MILSKIVTINYKSCRDISIDIDTKKPNVLIGMNDCGKTTFLQSIDLLLSIKSKINYVNDNSIKSDLSHTPMSITEINKRLEVNSLPPLNLEKDNEYIIVAAKFKLEDIDNIFQDDAATTHFKWLVYSSRNEGLNSLWVIRVFDCTKRDDNVYYLTLESVKDDLKSLCSFSPTKIKGLIKKHQLENDVASEMSNLSTHFENIKKLYNSVETAYIWSVVHNKWKKDIEYFPVFRYLDWNQSVESLKKTAKDILSNSISHQYELAKYAANKHSDDAQYVVDQQLKELGLHHELENIESIRTKISFKVDYHLSDLLIRKNDSENDVHIDSQGEGVKRQLWFALLKLQVENNTENSKKRFIWCFDEPETHLHPKAQRSFFSILKSLSKNNFQILISTHSTVFVDSSNTKDIYGFSKQKNYTKISESKKIKDIYDTLGLKNSDFLFYDRFLMVEGKTEEALIPYLYKLYTGSSLGENNIQLIVLDGCPNSVYARNMIKELMSGFSKDVDSSIYILDGDFRFSPHYEEDEITFLIGKQDIEDSISVDVWKSISNEKFGNLIDIGESEIRNIIDNIPDNKKVDKNHKFEKKFRAFIRSKLSEVNQENKISKLPSKSLQWGSLIAKHIKSKEQIPSQLCRAFDMMEENSP